MSAALTRRRVLAGLIAAPAVVRVSALMPVRTIPPIIPTGTILMHMGPVPRGFLECDGSILSAREYPELAALLAAKYGGVTEHYAGEWLISTELPRLRLLGGVTLPVIEHGGFGKSLWGAAGGIFVIKT